jgi:integrase
MNKPNLGKHSLGTRERSEAEVRLRELDVCKATELGIAPPKLEAPSHFSMSIKDGWERYLARCEDPEILGGVSQATYDRYTAVRDKHVEFYAANGITCWSEIDKSNANDYGRWLAKKKNLADRTIVLELNVICSTVKWLVEQNLLPPECRFLLKLSKPDGTSTYCYTKQQVGRMVSFCYADKALNCLGNVICVLAATGLRINELAKLRWSDIDFAAGTISLTDERARPRRRQSGFERRLKGKRGRAIPLNLSLRNLLFRLPRHRDGLVMRAKNGERLSDRRVLEALQGKVIKAIVCEFPSPDEEIGFEHGTIHGLRHYFVSEAYRNGVTDAELVEMLGHRDSQLLRVYRHLRPEDGRAKLLNIDFLGLSETTEQPKNTA